MKQCNFIDIAFKLRKVTAEVNLKTKFVFIYLFIIFIYLFIITYSSYEPNLKHNSPTQVC